MSKFAIDLAKLLGTVKRPGDFFVSGLVNVAPPVLKVDGVGTIAFPLLPVQAADLIAIAERAPYGLGEETLVDTKVRRTWQIASSQVHIGGKHWDHTLGEILARVNEGLGLTCPIEAELYKLLIYDEGSFFVNHRDTEKVPGMFATLVIVLPSISSGGELMLRHKDREVRLDMQAEEPSEIPYAAFYADCIHQVLPVTKGCRLTLVYNLLRKGPGQRPQAPGYEKEQANIAKLLKGWQAARASLDPPAPLKLIYLLEHAYSQAELDFDKLKGADAGAANVLMAAARLSGCELSLALLSVEESGSADYRGDYGYRRRCQEDEFVAGEVCDRSITLSQWRRIGDAVLALGEIPVEENEISPPEALSQMKPDEEHFQEATGNEGASFERTYRRAALVLWPQDGFFAVLNQAGLPVTLPYLEDLTLRWAASGEDQQSLLWQQAHDLSGHMISNWPVEHWKGANSKEPTRVTSMLRVLTRIDDKIIIERFLSDIVGDGSASKHDNESIITALNLLPRKRSLGLIEQIMAKTARVNFETCANLLARVVSVSEPKNKVNFMGAGALLVEAMPGNPARLQEECSFPRKIEPSTVVDVMNALGPVNEDLASRAADTMLKWPKTYELDAVLIPAILSLLETRLMRDLEPLQRLRDAGIKHLMARAAEPLEAPKDWRRRSKLSCKCEYCSGLIQFLDDPVQKTWSLRAAEATRGHVEGIIRRAVCDLDLTTDRRGRPYSLVCSKNQASYERRAHQRKRDLADLAALGA